MLRSFDELLRSFESGDLASINSALQRLVDSGSDRQRCTSRRA
jgi:hypothetical protein